MLNEVQEYWDYTHFPEYNCTGPRDTAFLGRFTIETIMDFLGMERIFTIIARKFLFAEGTEPRENIGLARQALCAWCSIPEGGKRQKTWMYTTDFRELHARYPELVDAKGNGWYINHIHSITRCIETYQPKMSKTVLKYLEPLRKNFDKQWRDRVRQFQIPIFAETTIANWGIHFDDIIANALTLGPLRNTEITITAELEDRLRPYCDRNIKMEHLAALVGYYYVNLPEDTPWVVLPVANFNMFFGNTVFSKKVLPAVSKKLIERSPMSHGSSRYKILGNWEAFLPQGLTAPN